MNKVKGLILAVIVIILVVAGGIVAKNYYNNRYVGTDYYARVASLEIISPEMLYDSSNNPMELGHYYKLRAYNDKGEEIVASFSVQASTADALYQDDTYLKISHSKEIVVSQKVVARGDVPADVLKFIDQDTHENR